MKIYDWVLLILSSLLYAGAFVLSDFCWPLIFLFPVLFMCVASRNTLTFKHGFVWSLSTFLLHMIGGIYVVAHMAHNNVHGFILALGVVVLQVVCGGLLFWGVAYFLRGVCAGVVILFLFIFWVNRACLFMFDVVEGYPLMHPLILFTKTPQLLWLLPVIGKNILTFLFLLSAASIVMFLHNKGRYSLLFCICTFVPWTIGFWNNKTDEKPFFIDSIKPIPYMTINHHKSSGVGLQVAVQDINNVINQCDGYTVFITPESSLPAGDYETTRNNLLCLKQSVHCICGASCIRDDTCYNSFWWVHNNTVQCCFDKKHAMLLSERLPRCLNNVFLRNAYFCEERRDITISHSERKKMVIEGVGEFVPYICSELFFNEYPDDDYEGVPIVVIVNDSVFLSHACSHYICTLLQMLARFKAIQWQRGIVYISYSQSFYCGKGGEFNVLT